MIRFLKIVAHHPMMHEAGLCGQAKFSVLGEVKASDATNPHVPRHGNIRTGVHDISVSP